MFILGLSIRVTEFLTNGEPVFQDDAAALLADGAVVSSIETKKLRKMKKNTNPLAAVRYVLKDYGIKLKAVDKIVVPAGKDYLNCQQVGVLNMNDYIRSWLSEGFGADINTDISFINPHLVYPTNIFNMSFYQQCLFLTIHRDAADFSVMISRGDRHHIEELDFFPGLEPGKFPLEAILDRLNFHQKNARHPTLCITGNTPPAPPLLEKITSNRIFEDIYNHPIEQAAALALGAGLYLHSQETPARDQAKLIHETYRNETERLLTGIWQQVLSRGKISINDNFFELGGNSFTAIWVENAIQKTFHKKLPLTDIFKYPTIKELSRCLQGVLPDKYEAPEPVEKKEYYVLSSAQQRLYVLRQMALDSTSYNVPYGVRIEGKPDNEKVTSIFRQLIKRHESLRISFHMVQEKPVQRIHEQVPLEIEYYLATEDTEDTEDTSSFIIHHSFVRPFDLSLPPLLRVGLIKLAEEKHILMVDMHHIITDGVSMHLFIRELLALYNGEALSPLKFQYKDYAEWQNRASQKKIIRKQQEYWLKQFAAEAPVLNLPCDYPRPIMQSFEGEELSFGLSVQSTRALNQFALDTGITLYMVLLAIYNLLLSKLSGQEDIVVGTPGAGRRQADLHRIVGMFVNTLAIRNYPTGNKKLIDFLTELKQTTLETFENQGYPFEELVEKVFVKRDVGRNPLFDTMFNLQNMNVQAKEIPLAKISQLKITPYEMENRVSKFDLNLYCVEEEERLICSFEYCTKLFKRETIERFIKYFQQLLSIVVECKDKKLSDIDILTGEERKQILYDFNDTASPFPRDKTLHGLFAELVEKTPNHIALIGQIPNQEGTRGLAPLHISYRQLNEKSNQLAYLLQAKGGKPDNIAAIMAEPSVEMIAAVLGILKAGGAYLPIHPDSPQERINYMMADSGAKVIINTEFFRNASLERGASSLYLKSTGGGGVCPNLQPPASPSNLAYVIYTSGTTGKPKGTLLKHQNLVNYVNWFSHQTHLTDLDKTALTASFAFDLGYTAVYPSLLNGAQLHILPKETYMVPETLFDYIRSRRISYLKMTPTLFSPLVDSSLFSEKTCQSLRLLVLGGEAIQVTDVEKAYGICPQLEIMNHYGPTEVTIGCIAQLVARENLETYKTRPTIGKPIFNTRAYILDKYLQVLPIGAAGELCLSSAGLARGYLNNPELTAEKFCLRRQGGRFLKKLPPLTPRKNFLLFSPYSPHSPHSPYSPTYRTGDLARWLADGNIEFLGRIDQQLKIRGFRVEPGEIESCLLKYPGVKEVAVIARADKPGNTYLCAYIVPGMGFRTSELKNFLSVRMPDYMIPSYFITQEHIPLTPNGKLDRKALPEPGIIPGKRYIAPGNNLEKKLLEIWSTVLALEKEKISIDANFFELGGHSLKATAMISKVYKELNVKLPLVEVFKTPNIKGLSDYIHRDRVGGEKNKYASIQPAETKDYYALASAQKRLYVLQQLEVEDGTYNVFAALVLEGELNKNALEKTFRELVKRHESLRTSFHMQDGETVQKVHQQVEFKIEYDQSLVNCQTRDEVPSPTKVEKIIRNFFRPFDLSQVPLLRVGLIKQKDRNHILIVDMHHIITDGLSMNLFVRETMALYAGEELPPLKYQYKDYAQWQNHEDQQETIRKQEEYWLNQFAEETPVLNLPLDYPRPLVQSFEGHVLFFELSAESTRALKQLALDQGATLFVVLLAIYNVLLTKLSNQEDIVVGTPIAARRHTDLERIVGMFVNTLALRNYPQGNMKFSDFFTELKKRTLEAFENQEYPFEELVEKVLVNRDVSRNPIFDTMFAWQNMEAWNNEISQLRIRLFEIERRISKFDLSLGCFEQEGRVIGSFEYCTKLIKKSTIDRFIGYFKEIVSSVVARPDLRLSQIEIISTGERQQILQEFNNTRAKYSPDKTIHQWFVEQAARRPDNIAVVGARQLHKLHGTGTKGLAPLFVPVSITYNELNEHSNRLAHLLRERGVKPDTIAAIMVERSIEMIIGILGILTAGAAYLPIDPEYPAQRIQTMLTDSKTKFLVTTPGLSEKFEKLSIANCQLLVINEKPPASSHLHLSRRYAPVTSLAYIIYTSGSTGIPRGVMLTHQNVTAYLFAFNRKFAITQKDTVVQQAAYSFDAFVEEVYPTLSGGGKLVIPTKEYVRDIDLLVEFIVGHSATIISCTPLMLNELNKRKEIKTIRLFISGGDTLKREYIEHIMKVSSVYNTYGPTETTVCATYYPCMKDFASNVPIGKPISNYRVYIRDNNQNLLPIGIPGELSISGAGVSRGYLNQPELTAEKFRRAVTSHLSLVTGSSSKTSYSSSDLFPNDQCLMTNDRLYLTGDLARWLSDGNIEFLGRIDQQVKIRGFRIEPGEIETSLMAHEVIQQALVLERKDRKDEKYLCAYIVSRRDLSVSALRKYLLGKLPDYMVPSYFVFLEEIPLTPHGKIDRGMLPEPGLKTRGKGYAAPRNQMEEKLLEIWAENLALSKEQISIDADFFQLGGHSLRATVMISKIHQELHVRMPLVEVFKTPTIRGMAGYLEKTARDQYTAVALAEKKEYYRLSSAQKRLYVLQQMEFASTAYNVSQAVLIEGKPDQVKMVTIFKKLIHRHESLRTSFHMIAEEPLQRIREFHQAAFEIEYLQVTGASDRCTAPGSRLAANTIKDFIRFFDLSQPPLLRVGIIELTGQKCIIIVDMHHIITDGTSMGLFISELMALYAGEKLPSLKFQYKDYSQWQNSREQKEAIRQQENYWLKQFEGEIPILSLLYDYPRPAVQSFEGDAVNFELSAEETRRLNDLALKEGATLYMILLAVTTIWLSKLSNQEDIIIGTPTAGRRHAELERIIGMFVNTLAIRNYPENHKTFQVFLKDVKEKILQAYENQEYPFEDLVEKVLVNRDTSRNPLFDVILALQNMETQTGEIPEVQLSEFKFKSYEMEDRTVKFDIDLVCVEIENRLLLILQYCSKLFKRESIEHFVVYFKKIISVILEKPAIQLQQIEIITGEEKRQIIYHFNDTTNEYPLDKLIHQLFAEQAARTPDNIAVVSKEEGWKGRSVEGKKENSLRAKSQELRAITYKELNKKSNQLARKLREKVAGPGSMVGIMAEPSVETIIGLLAILKSGNAYLPINPAYPPERKKYLLEDGKVNLLLTNCKDEAPVENEHFCDVIHLEDINIYDEEKSANVEGDTRSDNLAYIIYTSGSTGRPKGVMVEHHSVVRLVINTNYLQFKNKDRILQTGALEFDASTFDIWGALLNGLELYLASSSTLLSSEKLKVIIQACGITTIWMTASWFNQVVDMDIQVFKGLHNLLVGGDVLSPRHISRVRNRFPGLQVINGYGPTENTTFSTTFAINKEYRNIPIGSPIANSTAFIVDKHNQLVPVGVGGELLVGGDGVARGYLNNPELTAEKFQIPNKAWYYRSYRSYKSYILYRTGDLARWLTDGNIEFLGRIDHQIKIRGFRVELGEIESSLFAHPGIKEAVVLAKSTETGEKYLCAYIVSNREAGTAEFRTYLANKLPEYMVPAYFVLLDKLPLTPNGKIDRKRLPKPGLKEVNQYGLPKNELEIKLAEVWADVLGINQKMIGITGNFFELGGHSLKATFLASKISKEFQIKLPLTEIFRTPTIAELSRYIQHAAPVKYATIEAVEKKEFYGLSSAQQRLYILYEISPESIVYNIPQVTSLAKELTVDQLESVFNQLIARHEGLRTSFFMKEGQSVQRVHKFDDVKFEIEYYDLATEGTENTEGKTHHSFIRPFDLSRAPLLRVGLIEIDEPAHILMVDMHHIISDGVSHEILVNEFFALSKGQRSPELRVQYKDFAQWQHGPGIKKTIKTQENYWLKEFGVQEEILVLDLPIDYARPTIQSFEGSQLDFEISAQQTRALESIASAEGATLYIVLLTMMNIFFSKLSSQDEIVIGSPIAGRRHADLEKIIGMFVNTLALRNYPKGEKTFKEFLKEVKTTTLNALENQEYPFEDLVEKVNVSRDASRNPLFDVMFVMQNLIGKPGETPDENALTVEQQEKQEQFNYENRTAKFDLTAIAVKVEEKLLFTFQYCTKLFKKETIERFSSYFNKIAAAVATTPGITLAEIEIISAEEKNRVLHVFNDPAADYTVNKSLHGLFAEQVERTPDNTALVMIGPGLVTYRELNKKSNQLAHWLIKHGIKENQLVGLMIESTPEMIVGMLGILKAGCGYVPLNPGAPGERTKYILQECDIKMLLTHSSFMSRFQSGENFVDRYLFLDAHKEYGDLPGISPGAGTRSGDLAYVIFTSGSTGLPKGVPITHSNLCPLLHWGYRHLGLAPRDRTIQNLSYYFDWSVWEIFITLTSGAGLYMVPGEILPNPEASVDFMNRHAITVLHVTPSQYRYIVNVGRQLECLRYLFIGAETFPLDLLKHSFESVAQHCRVFNMYGPTECTIIAAVLETQPGDEQRFHYLSNIPIGKPIGNTLLLVLDRNFKLCPVNISGELYIGGDGLGKGYLNNPELTAEKFHIPNKARYYRSYRSYKTYILYKTGDLVRWLPDGNVQFLGRNDDQVKIRGFRIEPGEIENQLLTYPEVKKAVVLAKEDKTGDKYLCAYVVSEKNLSTAAIRQYLSKNLPEYMTPAYVKQIENIPLTPNGKIDRRALPTPVPEMEGDYQAPGNEIEIKLADIWSGVLGIKRDIIGINSDFFKLGGHSLKATVMASKISKEFQVKLPLTEIFRTPTIGELSQYIQYAAADKYAAIEPAEKKEYYGLSSAQQRLYILYEISPESIVYNIPQVTSLAKELTVDQLESVFNQLIVRHEGLRTSFFMKEGQPVQRVHKFDDVKFEIEYYDLATEGTENTEGKTHHSSFIIHHSFIRPFDLSRTPLVRVGLIEIGEPAHILMMDMHHIISDGVSHEILVKEFFALSRDQRLPELRIQYKDFAQWQHRPGIKKTIKEQEKYWLREFDGEVPVLNLPTDYARPAIQSFEGSQLDFEISAEQTRALESMASAQGATLYMVLLAVMNILFSKLSSQEDIIIGSPIAGRRHVDLEKIIGMFVNTLVLRNCPAGEKTVKEFIKEVKEKTLKAFANQEYPFEDLVEKVNVDRDAGRNPLFDVMFTLQTFIGDDPGREPSRENLPGIDQNQYRYENQTAKFDLTITAVEADEKLVCTFQYCTKLFKKGTIERFFNYFKKIVSSVIHNPVVKLWQIEVISGEEKRKLLYDFNDTKVEYPVENTIHQLFAEQAARTPDNIAVVGPVQVKYRTYMTYISYRELNQKSHQPALFLKEKGVLPDSIVGIMVERSVEMIIGILGILKAGAAYLPIDPEYPEERIDFMMKDSKAKVLLTAPDISNLSFSSTLTSTSTCRVSSTNLAYIIYTSGSTGKPKGVMINHYSVVNLALFQAAYFNITRDDRILLFSSLSFDASVEQIFISLFNGACLYIIDKTTLLDMEKFDLFTASRGITHLHAVPSFLNTLKLRSFYGLKRVVAGGDVCPVSLARRWSKQCAFYNEYGPTETTVTSIELKVKEVDDRLVRLPVGKPVANTFIYLLDRGMKLTLPGVAGEMYIGGDGLARGYLNRPELTNDKFLIINDKLKTEKEPFGQPMQPCIHASMQYQSPIYRTGDLARWLPDHNLEFLGRMDYQVKIRGFRIELGEIESRLLAHENVKEAVVTARKTKLAEETYLCAYIASKKEIDISQLRNELLTHLPGYMIPSFFIMIEKIPLTAIGKIDRSALPMPEVEVGEKYTAPRDAVEEKLAEIWSETLEIKKAIIGIDMNFFKSGGHSLRATVMAAKVHKSLNVKLPLAQVFITPTIRGLSRYIKQTARDKYTAVEPVEKKEFYGLSSAQQRLYILYQMTPKSIVYNMPEVVPLAGTPSIDQLKTTFNQLLARHEGLRTSFHLVKEEPVQKVHDQVEFEIDQLAVGASRPVTALISSFIRPFDLAQAPLLRVGLIEPPHTPSALRGHPSQEGRENKYLLLVDMHHIISDGVSYRILVSDFLALDRGLPLPELRIHYKDFAGWQNHPDIRKTIQSQENYWLEQFKGEIPVLNLPTDYVRPAVQSFEGGVLGFELPDQYTRALTAIASEEGTTLYMVLLAVVNIFFSKLSSQEDIVIGSPIAGRRHADLNKIIGMFVNTLALRNYPNGEKSFRQFLREVKEQTLQAFENQEYPFEDLVDQLAVNRDISRNPLFDVTFGLQNQSFVNGGAEANQPGAEMQSGESGENVERSEGGAYFQNTTAKFDLTIIAVESDKQLKFAFQYAARLFKTETIRRFITFFNKIVSSVVKEPGIKFWELEITAENEKQKILYDFNNTNTSYPWDKTIRQLFTEQAARTPDHIAVVGRQQGTGEFASLSEPISITYKELNDQSHQLADVLKEKGVKPNTIVGIMMERRVELLVGISGILAAGGAYLPIDPNYPGKRSQYMLDDSGVELVVVAGEYKGKLKIRQPVDIRDEKIYRPSCGSCTAGLSVEQTNLVYVIYTSGSTGRPKGVPVINRGLVNLVYSHGQVFGEHPGDRISQVAGPGFDAMASEIWPCLLNGGTLLIADDEIRGEAETMKKWLMKQRITISFQSTMIAEQLLNREWGHEEVALRVLRTAGEQLTRYPTSKLPFKFYNLYGPTEDTVWTTWAEIGVKEKPGSIYEKYPPIGQPIDNHRVYILGAYGGIQPIGIEGELCIAGVGLALGYLNNPELTAERFCLRRPGGTLFEKTAPVKHLDSPRKNFLLFTPYSPHSPYSPTYRTGDLARWLPDGNIEILGRIDQQVKIRGFRIELGEIEACLVNHPGITEAVVIVNEIHRERYLCAYMVSGKKNTISGLREYLSGILPDYMVPTYFTFIEKIPLTPNGKIDKKALPAPVLTIEGKYLAPGNDIEEKLVEIWREILGIEKNKISIDADFFQLGGHSLKATVLASRIRAALHVEVPVVEVFKNPTIQLLGEYIKNSDIKSIAATDHRLVLLRHEVGSDKHLFLIHDGTGHVEGYIEFSHRLSIGFNCWGIRASVLEDNAPLNVSIREIAGQYIQAMKQVQGRGPYFIAGWSLGGAIAFEMACQLEQEGEQLAFLGLVDSPGPRAESSEKTGEFSVESELNWVLGYLPDSETREKLKNAKNINQAWSIISLHLEERHDGIEVLRSLIPGQLARLIPDYHQQGIGQLLSYLNQYRTLTTARTLYKPTKKIETTVHYFKAGQSPAKFRDCWRDYCVNPINTHEIPGDHFSIFKTPGVDQTVKVFVEVVAV